MVKIILVITELSCVEVSISNAYDHSNLDLATQYINLLMEILIFGTIRTGFELFHSRIISGLSLGNDGQ